MGPSLFTVRRSGSVGQTRGLALCTSSTLLQCCLLPQVREWQLCGLPTDDVSVDNGVLVARGKRWPLLIDPQVGNRHIVEGGS
jgi:hypothetical protein